MTKERIHREVSGQGSAVVLTHGFGDDSTTWSQQVPALKGRHRVAAWDLLGHGQSARPDEADAYSRDIALRDLHEVAKSAGEQAVLIGHSLGGYLSMCRAIKTPEHVRGLVLIATGPGFRDPKSRDKWNTGVQRVAQRFECAPASVRLVEQHDGLVMEQLERIAMPVLSIVGERDRSYHAGISYLDRRLPRCRSEIIAGAGHHVHQSHADTVNQLILDFIDSLEEAP